MSVFALATEPLTRSYPPKSTTPEAEQLIQSADGAGQYLIEIVAYKGGEPRSGGLWTLTEGPLAAIPEGVGVDVGEVTFRFADRHWIGDP